MPIRDRTEKEGPEFKAGVSMVKAHGELKKTVQTLLPDAEANEEDILLIAKWLLSYIPIRGGTMLNQRSIHISLTEVVDNANRLIEIARKISDRK